MNKNIIAILGFAALVAAGAATVIAAPYTAPGSGVVGSKHDINAYAVNNAGVKADSQERVCAFCHTPHHAYDPTNPNNGDYLPLWSHEVTTQSFTPYASDTIQAQIGDPMIGPSRLCMSCHDGVVAIDTHYTNQGDAGNGTKTFNGDIFSQNDDQHAAVGAGGNLANDHPIGFDYDKAQADDAASKPTLKAGIKVADSTFVDNTVKISDTLHVAQGGGRMMTCATCHDVHNKDNVGSTVSDGNGGRTDSGQNYFVYASQNGSKLCVSCHNK